MPRKKPTKTQRKMAARKTRAHAIWLANDRPSLLSLAKLTGVSRTTLSGWRREWLEAEADGTVEQPTQAAVVAPSAAMPEGATSPSVITEGADVLTNLAAMRGPALKGLEAVLLSPDTPAATRLSAAKHSLALAGVVPPSRGSTPASEACVVCENRASARRMIRGWTDEQLDRLEAVLREVVDSAA